MFPHVHIERFNGTLANNKDPDQLVYSRSLARTLAARF